MPTKEEIIRKILQARPDLTREAIEENISRKKEDLGRLLTDEGAAYMVANDLGTSLSDESVLNTRMTIKDLAVGSSDVTITGTVVAVSQVRSFNRSDGRAGKVARIVVGDETGVANVVLWDEKAEIAEGKLSKGDAVRVNHGYVKAGLDGRSELNVGRRGSIVVLPPNLRPEGAYAVKEVYRKVREISEGDSYVNFMGFVKEISAVSTHKRSDGREGKVIRARLADETGRIMAVFWDEKTDIAQKTRRDDYLKIVNGQVRKGLAGNLEIHVGKDGEVSVLNKPREVGLPPLAITRIGMLTPDMSYVDVLARVTGVGQVREFTRSSGERGRVGEVFLMDETGSVRLSVWDDKVEVLGGISPGDVVLVEGGYTREGYGGINLNLGKMGTLKLNPDLEEAKYLPTQPTGISDISGLKAGFNASVRGKVSEEPVVKNVSTRDGREIRVASLRIRDDTGEIRASFWGDLADKFEDLPLEAEITVRNAYVKTGFAGELELSSRSTTEVETPPRGKGKSGVTEDASKQKLPQKISELQEGARAYVKGKIMSLTGSLVYMACPTCRSKVSDEDGGWKCRKCGNVSQPIPRLLLNVLVEDDSGGVVATIGGDMAEKLLGMKADYAWNVAAQSGDSSTPIEMVSKKIINKSITLTGRVRTNRYGELNLSVDSIE